MLGKMPLYAIGGINIAGLSLTGWWRASYSTAPWTSTASAGTSSGKTLVLGVEPGTGTSQNGYDPAGFNGTTEYLETAVSLDTYFNDSSYTLVMLVKPSSPAAAAANIYDDKQLFCSSTGEFGIAYNDSGGGKVYGWHTDNLSSVIQTAGVAITGGSYSMVSVTFDQTIISLQVNNGTAATVSATNPVIGFASMTGELGRNVFTGNFTTEDVLEVITANTVLTANNLSSIKAYFNSRYALSL